MRIRVRSYHSPICVELEVDSSASIFVVGLHVASALSLLPVRPAFSSNTSECDSNPETDVSDEYDEMEREMERDEQRRVEEDAYEQYLVAQDAIHSYFLQLESTREWLDRTQSLDDYPILSQSQAKEIGPTLLFSRRTFIRRQQSNVALPPALSTCDFIHYAMEISAGRLPLRPDEYASLLPYYELGWSGLDPDNPFIRDLASPSEFVPPSICTDPTFVQLISLYRGRTRGMDYHAAQDRFCLEVEGCEEYGLHRFPVLEWCAPTRSFTEPKLLVVKENAILRLKPLTQEIESAHPYSTILRWASTPRTIYIEFSSSSYMAMSSMAESIERVIDDYFSLDVFARQAVKLASGGLTLPRDRFLPSSFPILSVNEANGTPVSREDFIRDCFGEIRFPHPGMEEAMVFQMLSHYRYLISDTQAQFLSLPPVAVPLADLFVHANGAAARIVAEQVATTALNGPLSESMQFDLPDSRSLSTSEMDNIDTSDFALQESVSVENDSFIVDDVDCDSLVDKYHCLWYIFRGVPPNFPDSAERPYFYCKDTGISQWNPPESPYLRASPSAIAAVEEARKSLGIEVHDKAMDMRSTTSSSSTNTGPSSFETYSNSDTDFHGDSSSEKPSSSGRREDMPEFRSSARMSHRRKLSHNPSTPPPSAPPPPPPPRVVIDSNISSAVPSPSLSPASFSSSEQPSIHSFESSTPLSSSSAVIASSSNSQEMEKSPKNRVSSLLHDLTKTSSEAVQALHISISSVESRHMSAPSNVASNTSTSFLSSPVPLENNVGAVDLDPPRLSVAELRRKFDAR